MLIILLTIHRARMLAGDVSRDATKFILKEAKENFKVWPCASSRNLPTLVRFCQGIESVTREQFIVQARKVPARFVCVTSFFAVLTFCACVSFPTRVI